MTSCRILTYAHTSLIFGEQNLKLWNSACVCYTWYTRKYDFFIPSTWCVYFTLTTSCSFLDRADKVPWRGAGVGGDDDDDGGVVDDRRVERSGKERAGGGECSGERVNDVEIY